MLVIGGETAIGGDGGGVKISVALPPSISSSDSRFSLKNSKSGIESILASKP